MEFVWECQEVKFRTEKSKKNILQIIFKWPPSVLFLRFAG